MMTQDSWLSCEKTAVLQGGFLLANRLCQPASLSALQKEDWSKVGHPILQAVREICGQERGSRLSSVRWKKKIICILWSKLLGRESEEDMEIGWRENPFFSLQNSLPDINRTVMFELVKLTGFSQIYAQLLLCLPSAHLSAELEKLVQHVTRNSTEEDVRVLLEVWWELWKGRGGRQEEDDLDKVFTNRWTSLTYTTGLSPQAAKRFKSDPDTPTSPSSTTDVLSILFHALEEMKGHLSTSDLCYRALSNCLDSLYTSHLIDQAIILPAEVQLQSLTSAVTVRKRHAGIEKFDLVQVISEAQCDLKAAHTPSQFKPCGMTLMQALQTVSQLTQTWEKRGLLEMTDSGDPSDLTRRLKNSLARVLESLEERSMSETMDEGEQQTLNNVHSTLRGLLVSLSFPDTESNAGEMAHIAVAIINHRLEGFQDFTMLFATELSWSLSMEEWISCLEKNKNAFQRKDIVMKLVSTLIAKCQMDSEVEHCRKLKDIIVNIFAELPLPEKNTTLAEMLTCSKRGLQGSLPLAVTEGFSEELNMTLNCIIQGGAVQNNLSLAVAAIARVAFQNPEATLRRCCHLAVVNHGAHSLLSKILQQLSGLRGGDPGCTEGTGSSAGSLLCSCLQDTAMTKLSSAKEEDQFLHFLVALMQPSISESSERGQSFLHPEEVVCAFVLPHLSPSSGYSTCSLELCLRLLHSAFSLESQDPSPHWVMNCSPFPLLYVLCQILNEGCRCWELPVEGAPRHLSMESKEMLVTVLTALGKVVGREVASAPNTWSRALFWLYNKVEALDWTVRFHLKVVWGDHFKNEVPSSLLAVCELPEQEWSGLKLAQYGQGTGLLAWMECCALSDEVQDTMLTSLALDQHRPDDVNMFSKGLLVAVTQTLPWCTVAEWGRLLRAMRELLRSGRLHVPYSLEYVDFLPLLDLRAFSCELRLSVLLLRVLQLLCGSSCKDWLPCQGWAHVGRLYASATRELIDSLRGKLSPSSSNTSPKDPKEERLATTTASQEVLFVLSQLFCHVQHVQVMMPGGQCESLFLCALEILTHYEAVLAAHPSSSSHLETENTRHFFTTITDNLESAEMKAVLHQKIAQLSSSG
ncbi:gem-associated protein 4 [Salmo salar]|uniref:Gem-associated protein 4-like n=1 Tax=Salmo salar TaxID=8030 RepID=A0A1S3NR24_SALSA|nr:gem-associated protein 4 [Salmo salar]XP_014017657.1 gem-associated protein 4 [Salmo salar]|eukprot:XP_014017655.1 PREDICTED: gem-associated protein 4-like [Salmo salar]